MTSHEHEKQKSYSRDRYWYCNWLFDQGRLNGLPVSDELHRKLAPIFETVELLPKEAGLKRRQELFRLSAFVASLDLTVRQLLEEAMTETTHETCEDESYDDCVICQRARE